MYFEKTNTPWFGPTKRAKEILIKSRKLLNEPKDSISKILDSLEISEKDVNHFKFYDFVREKDNFRFTIVIVQTISNPIIRDKVYYNAIKCVEKSGWYPLVQGERLNSLKLNSLKTNQVKETIKFDFNFKKLLGYESACKDGDGTSIRILFENGSILFDSALPDKIILKESDKIVFFSHSHADHTGGILKILNSDIKIIINKETYLLLCSKNILNELETYPSLYIIGNNSKIILDCNVISSFPTPHCFGSIGYKCDIEELEIVYTGDIVIQTTRFDYTNFLLGLFSKKRTRKFIFLDSTMCMRSDGASQINSAKELLDKFDQIEDKIILITSRDSEQLIYSLIDLFFISKNYYRNQFSFIFPREIKKTLSIIHENFIKNRYDNIDRILYSQYGNSKSAWGESRWIYWIKFEDEINEISKNSKSILFIPHNNIEQFPSVKEYNYISIGKTGDQITSKLNGTNLEIDTTPWTMHSSKDVLTDSIINFNNHNINTIIFHDYTKRMSKYIEQFDFEVKTLNTTFTKF
jgi:glyoxylase-like metal-dependent hydrolase (beta-lactamase superfamily II)